MSLTTTIRSAKWHRVPVNHRGDWLFIELIDENGVVGLGEASHGGDDALAMRLLEQVCQALPGSTIPDLGVPDIVASGVGSEPPDKAPRTVLSAVEHAIVDIRSRTENISVAQWLGASPSARQVPIYTNLNRMCADRSPETVATAGEQALAGGVKQMKFAPFDEVSVAALSKGAASADELIEPARQRLRALRDAVGPDVSLMIDCHWRFPAHALTVLAAFAREFRISWIEDPFDQLTRELSDQLRDKTGALVTGGEHLMTIAAFEQYLKTAGVDVLIADVKHVGGIVALHKICELAAAHNTAFAPHNPSGPISTAASAQVVAANENANLLEYPFGEVAWRQDFAPQESLVGGDLRIAGPGLGISLQWEGRT